jgi:hypothetical protein
LLPISLFLGACGDEEVTIQKLCDQWGKCVTVFMPEFMECPYRNYDVFSKECLEGLDRYMCSEIEPGVQEELANDCWPDCSPEPAYCDGDQRVTCDGRERRVECGLFCEEQSLTGICGEEADGTMGCLCG